MYALIVKHPDVSREEIVGRTPKPELDYWISLENEYRKQGFHTRWQSLEGLDYVS